jgi:hypothetical protein
MIRTEEDLLDALRRRCDELRVSHRVLDNVAKFTGWLYGQAVVSPANQTAEHQVVVLVYGCDRMQFAAGRNSDCRGPQQRFSRDWEIRPERYSSSDARHEPIRRVINRNFLRKIGRLGNIAYAKKCHAERIRKRKISRINRANALKRWRRPQTTDVGPANASS